MSVLDRVREKFKTPTEATCKASKSPSAGSAGSSGKESEKFVPTENISKRTGEEPAKPAEALPADLDGRLRAMAARWDYAPEELEDVLQRASRDPDGWRRAVDLDERREQEFRERGLLPRADA